MAKDKAHEKTDEEIDRIAAYLFTMYETAREDVDRQLSAFFQVKAKRGKALYKAFKEAKSDDEAKKAKDDYIAYYLAVTKSPAFKKLSRKISKQLYDVNVRAAKYINSQTGGIYALNYNAIGQDLADDVVGFKFRPITAETADKTANVTKYAVKKKEDRRWNEELLPKSIVAAIILMEPEERAANRAAKVVVNRNYSAAKTQTSGMLSDAESKARLDALEQAEESGAKLKKVWWAVMDEKTRESHRRLNGTAINIDAEFLPGLSRPRDPHGAPAEIYNCRCRLWYKKQ